MRNIFDQYSQPENRVTHALVTALHEDRKLLRAFLMDIAKSPLPKNRRPIEISEQTYPGEPEATEDETEKRGIPDAWITAGDEWCLVIENKILSKATADQLTRHLATAKRLGYNDPKALVLTVMDSDGELPRGTRVVEWREVYRWLIDRDPEGHWARRVVEFLEVMEGRMVDQEKLKAGTLTAFNGFRFDRDNPFSYPEGKRLLGLATKELRSRNDLKSKLGMDPKLPGRKKITEGKRGVWDYLQIYAARKAKRFNEFPHLTLGISGTHVEAMVTVPDNIRSEFFRRMLELGPEGFRNLLHGILERMNPSLVACKGMEPRLHAFQRRFRARKFTFYDALIDLDLRTGFDGEWEPKTQPQWLDAVYACLTEKKEREYNLQIAIGAHFPYRTCDAIRSVDALNYVAGAWIACRPLIEVLVTDGPD